MKLLLLILAMGIGLFGTEEAATASFYARPKPLAQAIAEAPVVVVARLQEYTPTENIKDLHGEAALDALMSLKMSGNYTFRVTSILKGAVNDSLTMALPNLESIAYNNAPLKIENGQVFLLLLKRGEASQWVPVDARRPLIPLAKEKTTSRPQVQLLYVEDQVVALLLDSFSDPVIRQANIYTIQEIDNPHISKIFGGYVDDPNYATRDAALNFFINHGDYAVIPKIAQLEREYWKNGAACNSLISLHNIKSEDAVPYLNPLLFEASDWTRVNAIISLRAIANSKTFPYLILALRDLEPQNEVSYGAYAILHERVPSLGPEKNVDYFKEHRKSEIAVLDRWWQQQLSGRHLNLAKQKTKSNKTNVLDINSSLFSNSLDQRWEAVSKLQNYATNMSIPYLIVALQDPNKEMEYRAYTILHHLISLPGRTISKVDFNLSYLSTTKLIYDWWNAELLGEHNLSKIGHN